MTSLQAHLLIASPDLHTPFDSAVVLLVRHSEAGALGLILNRATPATLQETWPKVSDAPCTRDANIFLGGPCEGPLVALHAVEELLEIEVLPGLYFSAGKDKLESLAARTDDEPAKFFAGYAGWSAGQLENEIAHGSWSVMPAAAEHAFAAEDDLWQRTRRFVADMAWRNMLGIKQAPSDPGMN